MRLTRYTDYALRTLIQAALMPQGQRLSVAEITETYDISRSHVMKIVQRLGQLGYLKNVRGKGGGIELGMPTNQINIGQVVRDMEANLQVIDCSTPACKLSPGCTLKGVLAEAMSAFIGVLDRYTLEDLLTNKQELIQLLEIEETA
ncbi:Rrf2 family transcriptional regulator [Parendozoicomonas haliclonae]|uniref:HTH-type transcriptional repressor NsrR n=1 Tax=Parendozoicomonas haliclonae TaxID=1960125 RepID=A0A1X7AS08_9GAMM|nr:Rrf2 family transcriptional regulator [Parendozoicomonas haliclonae]SMA50207.1 HTH-type transcriptional repressor NsrR [Parendozoicomonas haliclonae]